MNTFILMASKAAGEALRKILSNINPKLSLYVLEEVSDLKKTNLDKSLIFIEKGAVFEGLEFALYELRKVNFEKQIYISICKPKNLKDDISVPDGANSCITFPFEQISLENVIRRAFSLPKKISYVSDKNDHSFSAALQTLGYDLECMNVQEFCEIDTTISTSELYILELKKSDRGVDENQIKAVTEVITKLSAPFIFLYSGRDSKSIERLLELEPIDILLSPNTSPTNLKKISDLVPLSPTGRRRKALIVDDSKTMRSLISGMFRELDYQVFTAENGFEGYKLVQSINPDIITSDYDMPVLNGWEFCSEIRSSEQFSDIPIIMITTRATTTDQKKGEILGVSAYLTKPFEKETLRKTIQEAEKNAQIKKEQALIAKFVASDTINSVNAMIDGEFSDTQSKKFISVLFTDIVGFSSKCEVYSARKIIRLLNEYFDLMVSKLVSNNAIIDKFIGDAIVARFDTGDPARDALDAIQSSVEMLQALDRFNLDAFEEIQIRIGINSGEVILGNLGSTNHRLEYAMIGDNVNIGQRLESAAPTQGCLIAEETYKLVKNRVEVGDFQEISVKGKDKPVGARELKALK